MWLFAPPFPPTSHVSEMEKLTVSAAIRSISFLRGLRFGRWEEREPYLLLANPQPQPRKSGNINRPRFTDVETEAQKFHANK